MRKGVVIESETQGSGREAQRGDIVTVCYALSR